MATRLEEPNAVGGPDGDAARFAVVLASVRDAIASIVDVPTEELSDAAVEARLGEAMRVRAGVEELVSRLVREATVRELPVRAGYTSATAWLKHTQRLPGGAAAGVASRAQRMTGATEPTRQAWAAGAINGDQAELIAATVGRLPSSVPAADAEQGQRSLIDQAPALSLDELAVCGDRLLKALDPAGEALLRQELLDAERRALAETSFRFHSRRHGSTGFTGRLPNLHADMLKKALDAYAAPRRRHLPNGSNSGEADGGLGDHGDHGDRGDKGYGAAAPSTVAAGGADRRTSGPAVNDNAPDRGLADAASDDAAIGDDDAAAGRRWRGTDTSHLSYEERLGRGLIDLIEHLDPDRLPHAGGVNATVVVTIDHAELAAGTGAATLDTGSTLSAAQARRLACNAALLPAVLGGPSVILDLGMSQRLFDRYQRIALAARDGGCVFPGCDRPPAWCEAHHVQPFARGGPTDLANGCLLCPHHHRLIHSTAGWSLHVAADGVVETIPPAHRDPTRAPRRHERLTRRRC